jgi:hypothetical protein
MPGAGDKQTEIIKMEKWRENWTICLAPGTKTHKNTKMAGQYAGASDKQTELIKMEKWWEKWTIFLAPGKNAT